MEKYIKTYIDVYAKMRTDGVIMPTAIVFDGKEYPVDKVTEIRTASADHVGGLALRYCVRISGRERLLFLENKPMRWFVEKRVDTF